jgi:hypothetical protein
MGQRLPKEEPKQPTDDFQFPSKIIIFLLFLSTYGLGWYFLRLALGTFYASFSAILGAGVLWATQARSEGKMNRVEGFLQTLLYRLGLADAPDMNDRDANVKMGLQESDTLSKGVSDFERYDGEYEWNPIDNGVEAADSPTDSTITPADSCESFSGQDDVEKNMLSDVASRMAARGAEANADPKDKARLDLLFHYLASVDGGTKSRPSVDGGNKEQANHVTPQRQKLQRKLLQRGPGDSSKSGKNAKTDDAEKQAEANEPAVITQDENLLEDSSKLEALLLELGEDPTKSIRPTQPKGPTKVQRKLKAHQKGGPTSSSPKASSTSPPSNTILKVTKTPSEPTEREADEEEEPEEEPVRQSDEEVKPVRQSAREADEEEKPEEDTSEPVGFQVVENRRARRKDRKDSMPEECAGKDRKDSLPEECAEKDRKDSMPEECTGKDRKDSMPEECAGKDRKDSMTSTPPADRAIAGQQVAGDRKKSKPSTPHADQAIAGHQGAPEVVKPGTPSAKAPKKKTNRKPVSKSEASAGPPIAPVASSTETRKPAWNTDSISERLAEATKANQRKSEAAAAGEPPETKSPQTKSPEGSLSPQTKSAEGSLSPQTKRNRKRWADIDFDGDEDRDSTSAAVPAKQTEDVRSVQRGSEEIKKKAPWRVQHDSEDVSSKENRHRTLSAKERQLSAGQSETYAHDSDFGVSNRQPEDVDPMGRVADGVDEADGQEDWCEEEEADGKDWEWQSPDGYPLAEYVCAEPTRCGSCGEMQPVGAKVLRAEESGWAACEQCIGVAYDQPISHQVTEEPSGAGAAAMDPSRMTTEQCVAWFKEHGSESSLRQCMQQVMTGNFYIGGYYYYAVPMN